ncbi:MAG: Ubiquinone biosynthesis protein coq9, mitochondrial [Chrysothrix sp. TS-e1954]|nr:MAG: Ubiquinone biosynthesis protein coq9, mitochondrial [Chrysothrix sp. TS-e1954]
MSNQCRSLLHPRCLSRRLSTRTTGHAHRFLYPILATSAHTKPISLRIHRTYYTPREQPENPYSATQHALLSAAIAHVPESGFTGRSLLLGARDVGSSPASVGLLVRGAYDLVLYHLVSQRLALSRHASLDRPSQEQSPLDASAKIRRLVLARLAANTPVASRLHEAFGLMSLASNIPPSLAELGRLSDEILFQSGDVSVDGSWYINRASLAAVYASTEAFMSQDSSRDFRDTEQFLDRRLEEVTSLRSAGGSVIQWGAFAGLSSFNVLRSWGARL